MKNIIALSLILAGCNTTPGYERVGIAFSDESLARSEFDDDYVDCVKIARSLQTNTLNNAAGGAAVGAGVYAATAAILGADVGMLAGVGALHGGVAGAGASALNNSETYKRAFVQCMRDREYQVYY